MSSAFRTAVESGDLAAAVATLAEDVEFRSPAIWTRHFTCSSHDHPAAPHSVARGTEIAKFCHGGDHELDTYQWKSDFALDQLDLWVQRAATINTAEQLFD